MTESKPRILVTGGAGFIGSLLTGILIKAGYKVRVADSLLFGDAGLKSFHGESNFEFRCGDLREPLFSALVLKDMNVVVHLAAIVGDPACSRFPGLSEEVNSAASRLLFNSAKEAGVSHFIFSSTCSNYGVMADESKPLNENSPLNPVSNYARQKTGFENFLVDQNRVGISGTILRFATAYGLSPRMRFDLTVNHFTRDLTLGRKLEIFGKDLWRPYCHASDLANSIRKVIEAGPEKMNGKIYNVGDSSENYSKENIVNEIVKHVPEAKVSYSGQGIADLRNYRVDFSCISKELGFNISKKVPDGVREVYKLVTSGIIPDPFDPIFQNA